MKRRKNKRNYHLVQRKPIHDQEYYKHEDYQDDCSEHEKKIPPPYVYKEEDVFNRCAINYLRTASDMLKSGKDLSELIYQDFRNLIKEIFIRKGWIISETTNHKNDNWILITINLTDGIGNISCICLPRKYSKYRKVGAKIIRDLKQLITENNVSIGYIITTSKLTKEAIKLINEQPYRMSYIDIEMLEREIAVYTL